jgi:hypothetical protein
VDLPLAICYLPWKLAMGRNIQVTRTISVAATVLWLGVVPLRGDEGRLFPKGQKLTSVVAIEMRELKPAERVMISTLQGNLAKSSSRQIFMEEPGPPWKSFLTERYGIPVAQVHDPWSLLAQFATNIDGYILYDRASNGDSVNVATSLCGPCKAIAVDASIEAQVHTAGVTRKITDVRRHNETWVYDHWRKRLNPKVAVELSGRIDYHLRDYAVLANAFVFYDRGRLRQRIIRDWPPQGMLMGYEDVSKKGEYGAFVDYSKRGIYFLGADLAANLSLLSSIYDEPLRQRSHPPEPVTETNVHYVTFLMSDGDNVAYDLWGLYFHYSSPARGKFNMGWPVLASLVDYAPAVLRWYYEHASMADGRRDNFVAQAGIAGAYLDSWPADRLPALARRLNAYMQAADMRVLQTIGYGGFRRLDVWDKLTAHPNIDGIFYNNYGGPNTGRVIFSNGKPVVDIRAVLWKGIMDEAALAKQVNASLRDPRRAEGYTAVLMHCWSMDLNSVQKAIQRFAPDVRVVTPEEFMALICKNVSAKNTNDPRL